VRPGGNMTRAEVATILFRLITDEHRASVWTQQNPFPDVQIGNWFNNAVSTMFNDGIFTGMPDGTFEPDRPITRAEFAVTMSRFFPGLPIDAPVAFTDTQDHWAAAQINAVASAGWVTGYPDGTFRPDQSITRAEVAAIVNRILGRLPETKYDLLPAMITWADNMDPFAWYYLYIQEATNSHNYVRSDDGIHETWVELLYPRNWILLEQPNSNPWDIKDSTGLEHYGIS